MFSAAYKRYALAALTTVYAVNLLDRGFMFMLLEPIRLDLRLTDTQVGFVTGIAFALFYSTLGVPIARWADRGNRVTITALALGLWGLTTMACSLVTSYVQLIWSRIAAGVGDAGCQPPIYSLLGDYFPGPAERTQALYVFEIASPLAGLVSFIAAGWINELYGWRLALLLAGIPGLVLAVVVKQTIKEPRLYTAKWEIGQSVRAASLSDVLKVLWNQRSCRHLLFGMVLLFTVGNGLVGWQAVFMIRNHGVGTGELGIWMALIYTIGPTCGLLLGIFILQKWFTGNERGQMRLAALAVMSGTPTSLAFLTLADKHHALIALIPYAVVSSAFVPATFALLQRLVPDEMRAMAMMVMLFFANLIGMGVGPQLVGLMSDLLKPVWDANALRYAMMIMSSVGAWGSYHFWSAGSFVAEDLLKASSSPQEFRRA